MAKAMLINRLRSKLRAFRAAKRGNVTVTFALAVLPIVGFVGAAVDYSHANSVRTALQAALDSTALMLSKEAANISSSQLKTDATNYFKAMFNRPEAQNVVITPTYTTTGGSQVLVTGTATVPTNFMGIMGFNYIPVSGSSTVKWGNTRLRVALVLDNTGSMADDGKMSALKTATKNLLNQLKSAATNNGDVYVSVIPFSKDVNLGSSNYNASWIDWTEWDAANGTCKNYRNYNGWGSPGDKSTCLAYSGKWTADNHNTWNGCVMDRGDTSAPNSGNYDTNVASPNSSNKATLYPAEQYSSCTQAAMGLSYDWTTMTSVVNGMQSVGNTNQGLGLQVGWLSLVGGGPFSVPSMDPKYKYSQIIILLTDGLNTQNRWYTKQSSIDSRQAMTCSNAKASGITIYTVQVNTGGDPTQSVLQNCASSSDKFFLLTSANQIVTTFNSIGTALSNLRIAK